MESVVKSMKIVGEGLAQKQRKDEFAVYGEYVANELRKFKGKNYDLILAETKQKKIQPFMKPKSKELK